MNHLVGSYASFRLSPEGKTAIGELFVEEPFQMKVVGLDELGLWLELDEEQCILLKWAYFSTVVADYELPDVMVAKKIGF